MQSTFKNPTQINDFEEKLLLLLLLQPIPTSQLQQSNLTK